MAYEAPPNHDYLDARRHSTVYAPDQSHSNLEPAFSKPRESSIHPHDQERNYSHYDLSSSRTHEPAALHSETSMPDRTRVQSQPINEAVGSAFTSDVPPELIAQITENVLKQLKTSGIDTSTTPVPPPAQNQYPPPPAQQPVPLSPSTLSGSSPPIPARVFTPPSPHKHTDYPTHGSPLSQPDVLPGPPRSPQDPRSPIREAPNSFSYDRRTSSPLSQSSDSSRTRPKGPVRLSTGKEETTLEKIWGQLFDEEGHPMTRLGQFLRGLAMHLIEDYEPRNSLVITPDKMIKYYQDVKLPSEIYPWSTVFDDERSRISRMYRDLECQHHLVQEQYDQRPDIPGLTPVGFERWVTILIQAHPEEEYKRLQKAVLDMPISNPDDRKERFPKEISRRLFPGRGDDQIQDRLENAICEHANIDLPKRCNQQESPPVPQNHRPSTTDPSMTSRRESSANREKALPFVPSNIERERKPYSSIPTESAIDDTNPIPAPTPSQPIERERKPYAAVPGGGKQFDDDIKGRESNKPRSDSIAAKPTRSDSTARIRPIPVGGSQPNFARPMDMPKPEMHHRRAPSNARRQRSPSFSNDYRRSDGDLRGYQATFQPGSLPNGESFDEDAARRYARDRAERARRQADEDARFYGESPGSRPRYDRGNEANGQARPGYLSNNEEDYYRGGTRAPGNGYDYQQAYGGPVYR